MSTYTYIAKCELSTTTTSVTFSSIPQTYDHLVIHLSARSNESDNAASLRFYFNNDTANISVRELRAIGGTIASYTVSYAQAGYVAANLSTANTFGTATLWIPNYRSSYNKSSMGDIVQSSTTKGENYSVLSSRVWSVTDAVTSITLKTAANDWLANSSFYLYGLKD